MPRWLVLSAVALLAGPSITLRPFVSAASSNLVELDVVVTDGQGRPVSGLTQQDFTVKEDGRPVAVTSFTAVSIAGVAGADGRSVVLLLDDTGTGPKWTNNVQKIANAFIAGMRPADRVSVVRLNNRNDEVAGGRADMLMRIAEFRAGTVTSFSRETTENVLNAVTRIGRQLTGPAARRTAIVCIGAADVCDIEEPRDHSYSLLWPVWADAMRAAAAAHLSVSVIDPSGLVGRAHVNAAGLVSFTGGEVFANVNDVAPAIDRIWTEAGNYYLLGYTPTARPRELHATDVSTTRRGVHLRARRRRGN